MLTPKLLIPLLFSLAPLSLRADAATDRQIEETAKTSYTFRRVLNDEIDVKVRNGVATLSGHVGDLDQSRLAEDTVANIEGVQRVENQIKVDPRVRGASDEWIAVKIRSKLLLDRSISLRQTKVDVNEGVVTLTGTAESPEQKAATEAAIKEIVGVRQVRNHLQIAEQTADRQRSGESSPAGETLPPGAGLPTGRDNPRTGAAETLRSRAEDTAITTQIKFHLLKDDATSGLKTAIDTTEGRVVVTGEAETAAQKQRVTELARGVSGVSQVENRMTVKRP